jgi:hypothetical protein
MAIGISYRPVGDIHIRYAIQSDRSGVGYGVGLAICASNIEIAHCLSVPPVAAGTTTPKSGSACFVRIIALTMSTLADVGAVSAKALEEKPLTAKTALAVNDIAILRFNIVVYLSNLSLKSLLVPEKNRP